MAKKIKMSYEEKVKLILPLLGGKSNIKIARHCVSRLRLVMNDMKKVKDLEIGKLDFAKGTIKLTGNQYHVVIGTDVTDLFKEFEKQAGVKEVSEKEYKTNAAQQQTFIRRMMNHFSEIFIPIIPVLVAAGLILGMRNVLEANFNGYTIVDHSAFMHGVNDFLWIPAQAGLWFLPVYIVWSIFKKMGGSPVLGIFIGLTMLIDPLMNVYAVSGQGVKWIWDLDLSKFGFDFGAWKFPWKISYTAQVIPAMLVGFIGVYIEKWLTKGVTPVLRQIVVPLVTVLASYTLAMVVVGPIGWIIGTAVSFAVKWALTNSIARYFFGPIFGLLYAPLVVTGMHHMLNAVMIQNSASIGGTIFFPILAMSNIAQGAATLAYMIMHKKDEKMKQIGTAAVISAWLGVTEPAMYGINTKHASPFFAAMIGSAIGSSLIVASGVSAAGIGNGAWLGVLSVQAQSAIDGYKTWAGTGYTWFILAAIVTTVSTMFFTYIFPKTIPQLRKIENDHWKIVKA